MSGANTIINETELSRCWRRWTQVVAACARPKGPRVKISSPDYVALHRTLLHGIRVNVDQSEGDDRILSHRLEELIAPWVTLESLRNANKNVLKELIETCRTIEKRMAGESVVGRWMVYVGLGLAAITLLTFLAFASASLADGSALAHFTFAAQNWYFSISSAVHEASFLVKFSVVTVVVVLVGMWMLSNTRTY